MQMQSANIVQFQYKENISVMQTQYTHNANLMQLHCKYIEPVVLI